MVRLIVHAVDLVLLRLSPYKYKDVNPRQINDNKCLLQLDKDGNLSLSMTHDYYYKVQGQLAICNKTYYLLMCI